MIEFLNNLINADAEDFTAQALVNNFVELLTKLLEVASAKLGI